MQTPQLVELLDGYDTSELDDNSRLLIDRLRESHMQIAESLQHNQTET